MDTKANMRLGAASGLSPPVRNPMLIIGVGCLLSLVSFGPRSALGFFLEPMSAAHHWHRDVFAFAIALQNLVWGIGQPVAGAIADRYGLTRIIVVGGLLFAAGLGLMSQADSALSLDLTAGVLIGFGLSGTSFMLVLAAFSKLLPERWRSLGYGLGTAAGSFGQFVYSPLAVQLNGGIGWQQTLLVFGCSILIVLPFSYILSAPTTSEIPIQARQSLREAIAEAFSERSYVLLVVGFFTCGFQLAFITVHLPAYLTICGLSPTVGGWTLATIGLFNILGSAACGWLCEIFPKRYLLSIIYSTRALAMLVFISTPVTPTSSLLFAAILGVVWLSAVPATNGIIAVLFGTRWLATLSGLAFFSHQIGGFLGAWMGGLAYNWTGAYDVIWWFSILLGFLSAMINLPIVEQPVVRPSLAVS